MGNNQIRDKNPKYNLLCQEKKTEGKSGERDFKKTFTMLFKNGNSGARTKKKTWQELSRVKLQLDNSEQERARGVIISLRPSDSHMRR